MFYDRFAQICKDHGISPSRAAIEAGLSKSTVTKWKTSPDSKPTGAAIKKLTDYFNISVSQLLGEETEKAPADSGKRSVSDEDIMFALFDGRGDITKEMYEEVKGIARFVAQLEDAKKKKE